MSLKLGLKDSFPFLFTNLEGVVKVSKFKSDLEHLLRHGYIEFMTRSQPLLTTFVSIVYTSI